MKLYNVKDFGAVCDGKHDDGDAIQKAIDTCTAEGGGTVILGAGEYYSHSIQIKKNVELYLYRQHLSTPDDSLR